MDALNRIFRRQYRYRNASGVWHYLFSKIVHLRANKPVRIYFMIKGSKTDVVNGRKEYSIPHGYRILENPKTGYVTVVRIEDRTQEED